MKLIVDDTNENLKKSNCLYYYHEAYHNGSIICIFDYCKILFKGSSISIANNPYPKDRSSDIRIYIDGELVKQFSEIADSDVKISHEFTDLEDTTHLLSIQNCEKTGGSATLDYFLIEGSDPKVYNANNDRLFLLENDTLKSLDIDKMTENNSFQDLRDSINVRKALDFGVENLDHLFNRIDRNSESFIPYHKISPNFKIKKLKF